MSYHLLLPYHIIKTGSLGSPLTSIAQNIQNQDNVGIQLVWSGNPMGTFDFQISNDAFITSNGQVVTPGSWTSLPLSPAINALGSSDIAFVELNQMTCIFVRIVYEPSGGTGTLDAYISAKGV